METQAVIEKCHERGVGLLAFDGLGEGQQGDIIASVGLDNDHSIFFHRWKQQQKLATARGSKNKVYSMHNSSRIISPRTCTN